MSKLRLKIGIISLSFMSMSALIVTNAYSAIIADFPNEPIAKIQMIGTIPSLGSLIKHQSPIGVCAYFGHWDWIYEYTQSYVTLRIL